MKLLFLLVSIFLISCETRTLKGNISELQSSVCMSSRGKGRIHVNGQKQVFSYRSLLNEEEARYSLDFTFPIYGTESVVIDYNDSDPAYKIESSFEQRLLREDESINPELVDSFLTVWAEFIEEILVNKQLLSKNRNIKFQWESNAKELIASHKYQGYETQFKFLYLDDQKNFEKIDIMTQSEAGESILLELIVRKCLEK